MDPIHFLSQQAFQAIDTSKPNPDEIDAFYEEHGLAFFSAISRWRTGLAAFWQRFQNRRFSAKLNAAMTHRN